MMMIKFDRELVLYVVFGAFTFFVNIAVYFLFEDVLGVNYLISNIIAWFFSVLFAYITNRIWVFESKSPDILKEMALFFGGRIFSGVVDTALMYLFIDVMMIGDTISKIVVQIIVIVLNYIFSKLIVFKD
ncbi:MULTISPECIES: GtrA family protein [unclassified Methanobrevibacter]|jgi:putative flippase GtrA|uniref:GtrA family protein n=1 Tax=Methanobrevibacter TaxID=2172 RepID=UPI001E07D828|nr:MULTISPECIES: GtrA family protein [unclassified Methanobrevibacter]MBE6492505.1 GtrA family protein [Methanobrevibacter sp.]MEE0942141.1 GtrA family protein [Methanobrevibacter sp.]